MFQCDYFSFDTRVFIAQYLPEFVPTFVRPSCATTEQNKNKTGRQL